MMTIKWVEENGLKYRELHFDEHPLEDVVIPILKEYEWNKIYVVLSSKTIRGPFYTKFEKGHNDFGAAFIDECGRDCYMINDEELSLQDYTKYQRREKLKRIPLND